jgi:hypothetical protein
MDKNDFALSLPADRVGDVLSTACDGAINYWGEIAEAGDPIDGGVVIVEREDDGEEQVHRLDRAALERGLQLMLENFPRAFGEVVAGRGDRHTADLLVQLCVLGEERYA